MTGNERMHQALQQTMQAHSDVVVVGEAVAISPATQGLIAAVPDQVHLLPAVDSSLAGFAVGLAWGGKRPVIELAESQALWGVLEHLALAASTGSDFQSPLVVRVPVAPGELDPAVVVGRVPGLAVGIVSELGLAAEMLSHALDHRGPVVLFEPREVMAQRGEVVPAPAIGQARVKREGQHATVLATGGEVSHALQVAEALAAEGLDLEVVDLCWLQPIDAATIGASVHKTGRPVLAGPSTGALQAVIEHAFLRLESPPLVSTGASLEQTVRDSVNY